MPVPCAPQHKASPAACTQHPPPPVAALVLLGLSLGPSSATSGVTPQPGQAVSPREHRAEHSKVKGTQRASRVLPQGLQQARKRVKKKSICSDRVSCLTVNWPVLIKSLQQLSKLLIYHISLLCSEPDIEVSFTSTSFAPKIHAVPGLIEGIRTGTDSMCPALAPAAKGLIRKKTKMLVFCKSEQDNARGKSP